MPLINVQIMEGRPPEKVTELIQNLTNTVQETLNAPRESIRVIVTEIPKTHWGLQEYLLQKDRTQQGSMGISMLPVIIHYCKR